VEASGRINRSRARGVPDSRTQSPESTVSAVALGFRVLPEEIGDGGRRGAPQAALSVQHAARDLHCQLRELRSAWLGAFPVPSDTAVNRKHPCPWGPLRLGSLLRPLDCRESQQFKTRPLNVTFKYPSGFEGWLWPHSCPSLGYVRGSAPRTNSRVDGFWEAPRRSAAGRDHYPRSEPTRDANHHRSSDAGAMPHLWRARPNAVLHVNRQTHHPLARGMRCALAAGAGSRLVLGRREGKKRA